MQKTKLKSTKSLPLSENSEPVRMINEEQLEKIVVDLNSKIDSNINWVINLLKNLLSSYNELNLKYTKLNERLNLIEKNYSKLNVIETNVVNNKNETIARRESIVNNQSNNFESLYRKKVKFSE
jgi:hypothetical protein